MSDVRASGFVSLSLSFSLVKRRVGSEAQRVPPARLHDAAPHWLGSPPPAHSPRDAQAPEEDSLVQPPLGCS